MARVGVFSPLCVAPAWFDATTQDVGFFDAMIVGESGAAPPTPTTYPPRRWQIGSVAPWRVTGRRI